MADRLDKDVLHDIAVAVKDRSDKNNTLPVGLLLGQLVPYFHITLRQPGYRQGKTDMHIGPGRLGRGFTKHQIPGMAGDRKWFELTHGLPL